MLSVGYTGDPVACNGVPFCPSLACADGYSGMATATCPGNGNAFVLSGCKGLPISLWIPSLHTRTRTLLKILSFTQVTAEAQSRRGLEPLECQAHYVHQHTITPSLACSLTCTRTLAADVDVQGGWQTIRR